MRILVILTTLILPITQALAQYCTPTYSTLCNTNGAYINNFSFATITNNNTGCNGNVNNYINTGLSTNVTKGLTYTLSMRSGVLSATGCNAPGNAICSTTQIGAAGSTVSGTSNTSTGFPTPLGNYYWGNKTQYLILASELTAQNIGAGFLTEIGFDVIALNSCPALSNFSISLGCTSASSISAFQTGLTNVYFSSSHTPFVGINGWAFTTPYYWDGTSNIIVEVCSNNANWTTNGNASVRNTTTAFSSAVYYRADNGTVCGNTTITSSSTSRAVTYFNGCQLGKNGPLAQSFGVWIDYNRDNDFADAGEAVYVSGSVSSATLTSNITIPGTAGTGTTRMRIRSSSQVITTTDYCSLLPDGETQDYTVNLVSSAVANDNCTGAIALSPNATCVNTAGTSAGATQSQAANSCSGFTGTADDDVWYSFVATSTNPTITVTGSASFDAVVELFSGSCGGLTSIGCSDNTGSAGTETVNATGLTVGQTYYIRVFHYGAGSGSSTFNICLVVPCNSVAGTASTPKTNILSNEAFPISLTGYNGTITWQYSNDGFTYFNLGSAQAIDTVVHRSAANGTLYIRAMVQDGSCSAVYSNVLVYTVRCATPFSNNATTFDDYMTNVSFNTINNNSTEPPYGGNVQDFTAVSTNVCQGSTYTLSVTPFSLTYNYNMLGWIDYNNDGDFTDAGENIMFTARSTGAKTVSVTIPAGTAIGNVRMRISLIDNNAAITSNDPCIAGPYAYGEIEEYTVNISAAPTTSNAGTDQTICNMASTTLGANLPTSGTGTWSSLGVATVTTPGNRNSTVTGLAVGNNLFVWTIASGSCTSRDTVNVVRTLVTASNAGTDQNVCATTTNLNGNNPTSGTGTWTSLGAATVTTPALRTSGVTGLVAGQNRFVWTITNGICVSRDTVTINGVSNPTAANAGSDQNICGTSASLAANTPTVGTGVWSVVSGSGTFAAANNPNTTVSGMSAGVNVYRWTISNAPCTASTDDISITVSFPPTANAGSDLSSCGTAAVNITGTTSNSTGVLWSSSGTGTFGSNTTLSTTYTPSATDVTNGSVTLTLSTTGNGACSPATDTKLITLTAPPTTANSGSDQTTCNSSFSLSANTATSGTGVWSVVSGSGTFANANSPTTTVSGMSAGANTYRWTITTASPCTPSSDDVTITKQNSPTANAGSDATSCGTTAITLNGSVTVATGGTWSGGSGSFGNNTVLNTTYTPSAADVSAGSVTLTLTSTGNGSCTPATDQVTFTLTASPTTANAGSDQTTCNSSVALSANTATSGTGVWSVISGSGTFTNASDPATTVSGMTTGVNVYRWTISTTSPCTPSFDDVAITKQNGPSSNAGTATTSCGTTAVNLSGTVSNATGQTWSTSGTGTFGNASSLTTTYTPSAADVSAGSVTITLTATGSGSCTTSSSQFTLTLVTPASTAAAGTDQTICVDNTTLAAATPTNGTGVWTLLSGAGTFTNPTSPTTSVTGIGTGVNVYRWTVTGTSPCGSTFDDVAITRNAAPTANAGTDITVCANNAVVNLSGAVTNASGGTWTTTNGTGTFSNINSLNTTYSPTPADTVNGSVILTLTTTGNGICSAATDDITITFSPAPKVNAGADIDVCSGNNATLSGTVTIATGGTWSTSGSGTFGAASSLSTTYTPSATDITNGTVTLTLTSTGNGTCNAVTDQLTLTISQSASTANAGTDQTICGDNTTLAANTPATGTGTWSLISGAGTFTNPNSFNSAVTGISAGVNIYRWTVSNGCGSNFDDVAVTSTAAPTADAGADQTVCSANTINIAGTVTNASANTWSTSGTGSFGSATSLSTTYTPSAADITAGTVTLTLTANGNGTCGSVTDQMTLTISESPSAANAGSDISLCGDSTVLTGNTAAIGTGVWTVLSGSAIISNASSASTSVTNLSAGVNQFVWTISNSCGSNSDTVTVTSTVQPVADAGADQNLCGTTNAVMQANTPAVGTGIWTVVSGSGVTIASPNSPTTSIMNIANGTTVVLQWTVTNGSCTDNDQMTISNGVDNLNLGNDTTICDGQPLVLNAGNYTTYQWSNSATTNSITVDTTGTYHVTVTIGSCTYTDTINVISTVCNGAVAAQMLNNKISIYPNPTTGNVFVQTTSANTALNITVHNVLGQAVVKDNFVSNGEAHSLDLNHLPDGIYTILIQSPEGHTTKSVTISR